MHVNDYKNAYNYICLIITLFFTPVVDAKGKTHTYVDLEFHSHSHNNEDESPPNCKIMWDYSYKVPSESNYQSSLLPGCYTTDSRQDFPMTYYWFYVLDWTY